MIRWLIVLAAAALGACFDPTYRPGAACSELDTCPPGQTCSNGLCALTSPIADAAGAADAPVTDAGDVDAAGIDAAGIDAPGIDADDLDATVDASVDALVDAGGPTCGNLVPVLTGPTPEVLSSGELDGSPTYAAWNAFDASLGTLWISQSYTSEAIIGYQWSDGPRALVGYAIHYTNGSITSRAPRDWIVQGHDGTIWNTLDRVTDQRDWAGNERRVYALPTTQAYLAFRLVISEDNDNSTGAAIVAISMGRLELLGPDCP